MSSAHRHAQITPNDHGPLVNVASWTLMVTSILFTGFRIISNTVIRGRIGKDDYIIVVATLVAAAQSIATSFMVSSGLGQHQDTLDRSTITSYQKALLASSTLYVSALAISKFSVLFFLGRLISAPQQTFRRVMKASWIVMISYLVAEVFALSFACDLPATYNAIGGKCIDIVAFWYFDTMFDIISGIAIMALPVIIVSPLQMKMGRKLQAIAAFAFQLPPCAFAVVRLVYLRRAADADDSTWLGVDWQVWTQINMHFCIVAANMPCLKIFMEGFQSMLFRQNMSSQIGTAVELQPYAVSPEQSKSRDRKGVWTGRRSEKTRVSPEEAESETAINAAPLEVYPHQQRQPHSEDRDAIYKTTEWTVLGSDRSARQRSVGV